jgi:hypothetical protein
MNSITQDMNYRLSLINYSWKYGVTKAAIKYRTNRQYIYRWRKRYDGTLESLRDRSRKPHSHPNQHTHQEIKLIYNMRRRNTHEGLVVFWVKLRQKGYTRSVTGLYRFLRKRSLMAVKPPNPKYIPKPYEQMRYPGQRVQIDVKHVPASCIVGDISGTKLYQYTALDEYSRFRYVEAFEELSTYSSTLFLRNMLAAFKFKVECIQTDNGTEFTNHLNHYRNNPSLFEAEMSKLGIRHKLIRPFTPRHNGKVERSHRKDNERFYALHKFHSYEDFKKQLYIHNWNYNNFPMRPLGWISPKETLRNFYNMV